MGIFNDIEVYLPCSACHKKQPVEFSHTCGHEMWHWMRWTCGHMVTVLCPECYRDKIKKHQFSVCGQQCSYT